MKTLWPVGNFIQNNLVYSWDDEDWQEEFNYLKEVKMEYVILQTTVHRTSEGKNITVYPTNLDGFRMNPKSNDIVETCLKNAQETGFKVFVGLNFDNKWWDYYTKDRDWFLERMKEGNRVAKELYEKYYDKYSRSFHGWYWPWEVENLHFKLREEQENLAEGINKQLFFMEKNNIRLPFMLSPFMNYKVGDKKENKEIWERIFSLTDFKGEDIFAPQDCIGAGGLNLDIFIDWFQKLKIAVDTKSELKFWANVENFTQEGKSAPVNRFIRQLKGLSPYVENFITFSYSHYYSPKSNDLSFHQKYFNYVNTDKRKKE
ncbi:MAG: DUF4434 domain-containing protein [Bacillota bacterium]